jgi:hypothetical protein
VTEATRGGVAGLEDLKPPLPRPGDEDLSAAAESASPFALARVAWWRVCTRLSSLSKRSANMPAHGMRSMHGNNQDMLALQNSCILVHLHKVSTDDDHLCKRS